MKTRVFLIVVLGLGSLIGSLAVWSQTIVPADVALGEYKIPGEDAATLKLISLFSDHFRKQYVSTGKAALRAVHAKSHGCLHGTFQVLEVADPEIKKGVFKEPQTFQAIIRSSNGDGPPGKDNAKLISIGFAIKVLGVQSEKLLPAVQTEDSQDFLMINQPNFLVSDVVEYEDVIAAREGGIFKKLGFGIEYHAALKSRKAALPKKDPLNNPYWSALPFELGSVAVKYLMKPCKSDPVPLPKKLTADYLSDLLRQHIHSRDVCYDFFIQKRSGDPKLANEMPIEDAHKTWDELKSVPIRVARLSLPSALNQNYESPEQVESCENLVFTPWNTTKDFRPIGSLNRIRRTIYELSSEMRHSLNNTQNPLEKNP